MLLAKNKSLNNLLTSGMRVISCFYGNDVQLVIPVRFIKNNKIL